MGNRISKKEELVEKALGSLQLIQDTYKGNPESPDFRSAWNQANINTDALRKYLDKTGEKLVYLGDDPYDLETIKMQDLSLQLGRTYVDSRSKYNFKGVGKSDIRTGSPYSEMGAWLQIGGPPSPDSGFTNTVNLSGDDSYKGWLNKSTALMEPITVKGRR